MDALLIQGGVWDARTEVLWSNRPLSIARQGDLFDTGAAG